MSGIAAIGTLYPGLWTLSNPVLAVQSEIRFSNFSGLHAIDWVIIAVYASIILAQGWYFSRGQSSSQEFFVASNKHLGPISIGISIFATLMSTISYLGKPGEMINKGPVFIIAQILSIPFVYFIVAHVFLPIIMKKRVTSVYEFLEEKVGLVGRLSGATLFIFLRLVWMALMIYLTSMALTVVTGLGMEYVNVVSLVVGMISIAYSTLGGIRAVVKTDVVQASLFFIGAAATIGVVTWHCGGVSWFPTEWSPNWDTQPWFSLDPHVRISVMGSLAHLILYRVATFCSDQTAVQRFMTLKDLKSAQRSILYTSITVVLNTVILALVGLALLGFFTQFTLAIPPEMSLAADADQMFPYFIAHYLPAGLSGLVVAAFLAAAMSSLDSGVSSITAILNTDFITRLRRGPPLPDQGVARVRIIGILIGLIAILLSFIIKYIPGNILEMTNKTANLVTVPIFTLFFMAWFFRRVTPMGAMVGTVAGILSGVLVGFWDLLTGGERISFLYMGFSSLVLSLSVGYVLCRFGPPREAVRATWIWGFWSLVILFAAATTLVILGRNGLIL